MHPPHTFLAPALTVRDKHALNIYKPIAYTTIFMGYGSMNSSIDMEPSSPCTPRCSDV